MCFVSQATVNISYQQKSICQREFSGARAGSCKKERAPETWGCPLKPVCPRRRDTQSHVFAGSVVAPFPPWWEASRKAYSTQIYFILFKPGFPNLLDIGKSSQLTLILFHKICFGISCSRINSTIDNLNQLTTATIFFFSLQMLHFPRQPYLYQEHSSTDSA